MQKQPENTNKKDTTNPNQCVTVGAVSNDGKVSINIGNGSSHINDKEVKGLGSNDGEKVGKDPAVNSNNGLTPNTLELDEKEKNAYKNNEEYTKLENADATKADEVISNIDKTFKMTNYIKFIALLTGDIKSTTQTIHKHELLDNFNTVYEHINKYPVVAKIAYAFLKQKILKIIKTMGQKETNIWVSFETIIPLLLDIKHNKKETKFLKDNLVEKEINDNDVDSIIIGLKEGYKTDIKENDTKEISDNYLYHINNLLKIYKNKEKRNNAGDAKVFVDRIKGNAELPDAGKYYNINIYFGDMNPKKNDTKEKLIKEITTIMKENRVKATTANNEHNTANSSALTVAGKKDTLITEIQSRLETAKKL